jgi:predicted nucleotidyltransferase component of viral defense system
MTYTPREQREIFHFCFLERLLRISDPGLYILKGGVNLRFFFNSPRYSEDMDFDVVRGSVSTLKKNGYKILADAAFKRSLNTYGIEDLLLNDPAKAKQMATTQRFRLRLVTGSGDFLPTKIEFSRREKNPYGSDLGLVRPEIAKRCQRLAFRCPHYSGGAMILQKIQALAGRPVTQARDVFDLYILHAGGFVAPPQTRILSKELLAKARKNLAALSYDEFSGHVLEFLEGDERGRFSGQQNWQFIKDEIGTVLNREK